MSYCNTNPAVCVSSRSHLSQFQPNPVGSSFLKSHQIKSTKPSSRNLIKCGIRELRQRIDTVKNTQKITEAMKLVAAARVRRAQEAVITSRPFSEALVEVLYEINEQLQLDDVEVPLTAVRPVERVALVVVSGDRGLCGGFNNAVVKKAEARIDELMKLGVECSVVSVGKKGNSYFRRREGSVVVDRFVEGVNIPTAKEAQCIADDVFSMFVTEEVDKVELVYTKFVSLVKSDPVIHTLLPLSSKGEVIDVNGNSVDAVEDEYFRLTSKEGKLSVERDVLRTEKGKFLPNMEFEQDPVQIIDALMPLYLNSQILRALQESLASELAARMGAMSNATDNANELKKNLSMAYNRERQAKITGEILEIVAGEKEKLQMNKSGGCGGLWRTLRLKDGDFQEHEVWNAYEDQKQDILPTSTSHHYSSLQSHKSKTTAKKPQSSLSLMIAKANSTSHHAQAIQHSAPVSIPDWSKIYGKSKSQNNGVRRTSAHYDDHASNEVDSDENDDNDDELYPHEWLARKHSRGQKSSFSVVEGVGRTLKGRDLRKVRDAVLTETGFIE